MKLEEPVELERLARLHELLEAENDRQIRNQRRSDLLVSRNWRLAHYVVSEVVGQRERNILFDEIGQRHLGRGRGCVRQHRGKRKGGLER